MLEEKLRLLPDKPGVYIMKNESGKIIYVGKAISLKNRVRQYFQSGVPAFSKTAALVAKIRDFEYIVTDTEMEALILECNLIKKHRPRYNIMLKDDKMYPYIKATLKDDYPQFFVTRNIKKDGSRYFGPYTDATAAHKTVEAINKILKLRVCRKNITRIKGKERPCLNYHINNCMAPCLPEISKEQYSEAVTKGIKLLEGKVEDMISFLEKSMEEAAELYDFEKAAEFRDTISAIRIVVEKQKIVYNNSANQDVVSFDTIENDVCFQVFFIRNGKIVGREHFLLKDQDVDNPSELLSEFIKQLYEGEMFIPNEILVPVELVDQSVVESWLTERRGAGVKILVPQKGDKKKLLEMLRENAEEILRTHVMRYRNNTLAAVDSANKLAEMLALPERPRRIEAYDISNLQGMENVGSMVVFSDGRPDTRNYRRFKIKGFDGQDDYGSLEEILERRFARYNKDTGSEGFGELPDLILMDGGKGQITIAEKVLRSVGLSIPIAGMVKDDKHKTRGLIFQNEEIDIRKQGEIIKLISHIQDEAHRFAINYHRSLRAKNSLLSVLDNAPGIGPRRKKALILYFGSVKKIKEASLEEIAKVDTMSLKLAEGLKEYLKKN